jgi:hypothetical protein
MHFLSPSWQLSATLCGGLTALWIVLRLTGRFPRICSFAREFAVVMALLGLWQYVGRFVRTHSDGAMERANQVQSLQDWLHLPNELSVQHLVLPHPWLVQAMNGYYAFAHLNGMTIFLIWVWWRRRESFRTVRNTIVGSTLICLLVQTIPVAPPRLLIGGGYVDTALLYGQSVYGQYETGVAAQLTAMPSVHVGWAFIVAWYVARLGRGPWRWIGCVHLVVTVSVVVATANHWWMDGIVAILITFVVLAGQALVGALLSARAQPDHENEPEPRENERAAAVSRRAVESGTV